MLKKRIIPCLDIKNGRTVKGVNFTNLQDAGNPVEQAALYAKEGADELVFLDIAATLENRSTLLHLVEDVGKAINIPFTVGGGITSVDHAYDILRAGADKISINSAAVKNPSLIQELSQVFGNQCVVVAVDCRQKGEDWYVATHGGTRITNIAVYEWLREAEKLGAGEILLTSMEHDGTKKGFATDLTQRACEALNIPIIASGGAGEMCHFKSLFTQTSAQAGLAASIFHFGQIAIPDLKKYLKNEKIPIR